MTEPAPRAPWPTRFLRSQKGAPLRCIELRQANDLLHEDVPIVIERSAPLQKGHDLAHMVAVPEGVAMVGNIFMPPNYCRLWYADGTHRFIPPREGRIWIGKGFKRRKVQSSDVSIDVPYVQDYRHHYLGKRVISAAGKR